MRLPIFLADIPAETFVWIIVGIIWAAFQILTRMAAKRARSGQPRDTRTRLGPRPAPTADPVAPTQELQKFLREITQQFGDQEPESEQKERVTPAPLSPHRPMRPPQTDRRFATTPRDIPPRPAPAAVQARKPSQLSAKRIAGARPPSKRPALKPADSAPARPEDWKTAVIHREILGPPRALRPYAMTEY